MTALTLLTLATALPDFCSFLLDFSGAESSCPLPSTSLKPPPPLFSKESQPSPCSVLGSFVPMPLLSFPSLPLSFSQSLLMISISILMHRPPDSPPWELQACVIDNLEDSRGPTTPLVLGGQGHKPFLFAPLPKLAAPPFPETSHAGL